MSHRLSSMPMRSGISSTLIGYQHCDCLLEQYDDAYIAAVVELKIKD